MAENEKQPELKPARFGKVIKKSFSDIWDYLGLVIVSSAICTLILLLPGMLSLFLGHIPGAGTVVKVAGSFVVLLIFPPVLAGVFAMAYRIVYKRSPGLLDIALGFKDLLLHSWLIALINIVVIGILLTDIAFFFGLFGPLKGSLIGYIVGALSLYLLLMWMMMTMYQLPALVAQKPLGQQRGALPAVKKSFLLAIGNPGFTIKLFVVILGFSVLGILSVVAARISPIIGVFAVLSIVVMLVLYAGAVSIILTHALRELFIRYGVIEEPSDTPVDEWER